MSTLITNVIQSLTSLTGTNINIQGVNTIKKDASTTNATLNANGTITTGNAIKQSNEWNSSFRVGVFNNNYSSLSSYMDSSHATGINTAIYLINPRLVFISWYFYKNSHFGTWNANYGWGIQLPSDILPLGAGRFCYQAIPANYFSFNGTNHFNAEPHRWQSNTASDGSNHNLLSCYGAKAATNWTSGSFETSGAGMLALSTDVTTAYA